MPFSKKILLAVIIPALLAISVCAGAVAVNGDHVDSHAPSILAAEKFIESLISKIDRYTGGGGIAAIDQQAAGSSPVFRPAVAYAADYVIGPRLKVVPDEDYADLLGQSAAALDTKRPGQAYTLNLACAAVNGTVLKPGAVFPLSERLGRYMAVNDLAGSYHAEIRSEEKRSGISRLVGVIHSAASQANLGITQRAPCLWPSDYLLPGYDPIFDNNFADIELTNKGDLPLYLSVSVQKGCVEARIYGGRRGLMRDQLGSIPSNTVYPPEKAELSRMLSLHYTGLIFGVPRSGREIALTFDDGPDPDLTPEYLKVLREEDVRATFFLVGRMVRRAPGMAAMIAGEGHEIGNHTMNHEYLANTKFEIGEQNLVDTNQLIEGETHESVPYFRPPGGRLSPGLIKMAQAADMKIVLWNIDPRDWTPGKKPEQIISDVVSNLQPGAIVIMHEGKRQTLEALPMLIREIRQRGWRLVTISELLTDGITALPAMQPQTPVEIPGGA